MTRLMEKITTQTDDPYRRVYDEKMLHEMGYINMQIGLGNSIMQEGFQEIQRSIGQVKRKQRKSLVNTSIALLQNDEIALVETYDDGSQNLQPLVINVRGNWHVYRIKFRYIEPKREYFALYFSESGYWIIGDVGKNTEGGLYDYFIRGNVKFASNLSRSKIKRALFEKFGPEIDLCRDMFTFPELAGWNGDYFVTAENFAFPVTKDFPSLPVRRKHFKFFVSEDNRFARYVGAMKGIKGTKLRAMLSAFPLAALIATIFAEAGFTIPVILNFISDDERFLEIICGFFQIYNRQEVEFISLDDTYANLRKSIEEAKDEILIFSTPNYIAMEGYRRRKVAENFDRVIYSYFHPSSMKSKTESPAHAIVFVSDRVIRDKNVLDVFVEKSAMYDFEIIVNALPGSTMPEIFTAFIDFCEKNLSWVRNLISVGKTGEDPKQEFGKILRRLIVKFGEYVDFDFLKELNIDQVDFGSLFTEDEVSEDNLSDILKNVIRKEIVHFTAKNKKTADSLQSTLIYFDEYTVWISPQILRIMLGKNGLLPQKIRILHEAREKGMLITDIEGYTRRMQLGGKRVEMYQFRRKALNISGAAEIIDLSKEDSKC